ncbi:MAG: M61 family metallopeptidase [Chitinophagaceae bacterium]|nr:M61 family metallopeptidase [Chitinophagaceae bacterium]
MYKKNFAILVFVVLAFSAPGQHPLIYPADVIDIRYAMSQPAVGYTLRVDTNNLSGYDVEINIKNAPKTFHLAMATHKEYDDRYWRYVENFRAESKEKISFERKDSALWKINSSGKNITIKYRIHLPVLTGTVRPVWRPFLSKTGGLVGDMHSFMYLVEDARISSYITFKIPENWKIATGLASTSDAKIFYASSAKTLMDCSVMVGNFLSRSFIVQGIPHKIAYWLLPDAKSFDTSVLVKSVKKIVKETIQLFGKAPYKNYTFLFQDGAYGALEHNNSVTMGLPTATFQRDITDMYNEIAHEYFHTWNLVALRPAEYSDLNYGPKEKAKGLWWSEGMSIFYSDLILRRANLPTYDSTRIIHLEKLIERYFSNSGNYKISPESSSLESNEQPGGLGDYYPSVHLQGEITGAMLDLIIRDASNSKYSIDDVMRKMYYDFPEEKGFYGKDIEQSVKNICGCDAYSFFQSYVYNANILDFNRYLKLIGKKVNITWKQAVDEKGDPSPDLDIFIYRRVGDTVFSIGLTNPESCWAKAGLHTNDKVIFINDMPVTGRESLRNIQRDLKIGDNVKFTIKRNSILQKIIVPVTGYNTPTAIITDLKNTTMKQQRIFQDWYNLK